MLGKTQQAAAYAFFKPVTPEGQTIGGEPFRTGSTGSTGSTGAQILEQAPGYIECSLVQTVASGDHSIFIGAVVDAGVSQPPAGRPDDVTLTLQDIGENVFYGG